MAAIEPAPFSATLPMADARWAMSLNPSSIESIPEATIAAYSPSEWPATPEASIPFSLTHWRAASEVAMMAGWATVVAASSSAVPWRQAERRSKWRMSEAQSNTRFAAGDASATSSAAMPGGLGTLSRE